MVPWISCAGTSEVGPAAAPSQGEYEAAPGIRADAAMAEELCSPGPSGSELVVDEALQALAREYPRKA